MQKVNARTDMPTSDGAQPDIRCPADNKDNCRMSLSESVPCHPHPDSYHRHSTHPPHHIQNSHRNHSLILPSFFSFSLHTSILTIYDKPPVCKGVTPSFTGNLPDFVTFHSYPVPVTSFCLTLQKPRSCTRSQHRGLSHFLQFAISHIVGSGHLYTQCLIELDARKLVVRIYPEDSHEIEGDGC